MGTFWEPVNDTEANEIIRLYKIGLGGDRIIDRLFLDCSRPGVIAWLERNGVEIRRIGSTYHCFHCNDEFIIENNAQRFCKECVPNNKGWHLLNKYGITLREFNCMLEEQLNSCDCCGTEFNSENKPYVDHCHKQNYVRGLVCNSCNIGLGFIENDKRLAQGFRYIEKHKK